VMASSFAVAFSRRVIMRAISFFFGAADATG